MAYSSIAEEVEVSDDRLGVDIWGEQQDWYKRSREKMTFWEAISKRVLTWDQKVNDHLKLPIR